MTTTLRKLAISSIVSGVALLGFATVAHANHADNYKVTICHATASEHNPYTVNSVSYNSIDNVTNVDWNGHGDHEGDIIPPFADFPGRNWDAQHQAIWHNECNVPEVTTTTGTKDTTPDTECDGRESESEDQCTPDTTVPETSVPDTTPETEPRDTTPPPPPVTDSVPPQSSTTAVVVTTTTTGIPPVVPQQPLPGTGSNDTILLLLGLALLGGGALMVFITRPSKS